jgi:predicted TIM-barrel fold metal-dependent hydrolase
LTPLRESRFGDAEIVAWENRQGKVYTLIRTGEIHSEAKLVKRAPSNRIVESARRVVFRYKGRFYTATGININYPLDAAIDDIESDTYKEVLGSQ